MKISTNWLKDYIDLARIDLRELALRITKAGVNVERIESYQLDHLVIGQIESVVDHPDSDHLHVCMVNTGSEVKQIVCGADNVAPGAKIILALPGAILPGDFEIKKSVIRKVESNGMICAIYELGIGGEDRSLGIHILPDDAPVGADPMAYMGLDDTIYDLDLNPNRNDCLSHIGFAYEVSAVLKRPITLPDTTYKTIKEHITDHLTVRVDTDYCPYYSAKMVKGVTIKESPEFIKQRLISAGMRPINNVVDISNYIMLEYGQPLHFFDQKKLGNQIVVRMAHDQEITITLDRKERTLTENDLVITDGKQIVCIAGVMGGANSEVDAQTTDIVIESAIFDPYKIRYTANGLDLRSEASSRYEKGLYHEYTSLAIDRACHLLELYANGTVLDGTIVVDNLDKQKKVASVSRQKIETMLGISLSHADIVASLEALQFPYTVDSDTYTVTIPGRRMDVSAHSADLVEEIGRLYGYDNIKGVLPVGPTKPGQYMGNVGIRKLLSKRLRALGLHETKTYTLISAEEDLLFDYTNLEAIRLLKPISNDKTTIRRSILPSLLKVFDYNLARHQKDIFVYEIANTYYNTDQEEMKLAIGILGSTISNRWLATNIEADFYTMKGIIENLLDYLGFSGRYTFQKSTIVDLHPGITAEVLIDGTPVGFLGRVHPKQHKEKIVVAELSFDKIVKRKVRAIKYKEASKYPLVHKDVAFVVPSHIQSSDIEAVIKKAGGKLLTNIDVFDVYVGEKVQKDEKSIAYSLTFSDPLKTLQDQEINTLFQDIIKKVKTNCQAQVRDH